jgi:ubiquitin carboxyl-terminal hydrolase 25/28
VPSSPSSQLFAATPPPALGSDDFELVPRAVTVDSPSAVTDLAELRLKSGTPGASRGPTPELGSRAGARAGNGDGDNADEDDEDDVEGAEALAMGGILQRPSDETVHATHSSSGMDIDNDNVNSNETAYRYDPPSVPPPLPTRPRARRASTLASGLKFGLQQDSAEVLINVLSQLELAFDPQSEGEGKGENLISQ